MRIAWIVSGQALEPGAGALYSKTASYRYRMIIPAQALKQRGHEVFAVGASEEPGGYEYAWAQLRDAEIAVFGKMRELELQDYLLEAARRAGIRTVVDVCDDYFTPDAIGRRYAAVVARGDAITTSSEVLAARISETTGRPAIIIVDPCEGARGAPRWKPGARIEGVWFGQEKNFVGLEKALPGIAASGVALRITVVTGGIEQLTARYQEEPAAGRVQLEFREWSVDATARALQACDLVLIPIDRAQQFYLSKGPNRLVESLWAGRFVIAHTLPAYERFAAWAWVGEDIAEGLRWTLEHPAEIEQRIARAQERIAVEFSVQSVTDGWERLLSSLNGADRRV